MGAVPKNSTREATREHRGGSRVETRVVFTKDLEIPRSIYGMVIEIPRTVPHSRNMLLRVTPSLSPPLFYHPHRPRSIPTTRPVSPPLAPHPHQSRRIGINQAASPPLALHPHHSRRIPTTNAISPLQQPAREYVCVVSRRIEWRSGRNEIFSCDWICFDFMKSGKNMHG